MEKNIAKKLRNLEKRVDSFSELSKYCPEHKKKLKYHGNDSFGNSVYECKGPPKHHITTRDERSKSMAYFGKNAF
ncbi:MAG: hypothetical protein QW041_01045 [Candidatus Pacearchaeota archaeon]